MFNRPRDNSPETPRKNRFADAVSRAYVAFLSKLPPKPQLITAAAIVSVPFVALLVVLICFHVHYSRIIDNRLASGMYGKPALILAAPRTLEAGQAISAATVLEYLHNAGYTDGSNDEGMGTYSESRNAVEIHPGRRSYFRNGQMSEGPARLEFKGNALVSIRDLTKLTPLHSYLLEPEPITTICDASRAKRRLITLDDLPNSVVRSILATEDHRFYSHHGIDGIRMVAAAIADIRSHRRVEGGSTVTMQLARNLFLTPQRSFSRKFKECLIAMIIEHRLSKNQILMLYANQVYFGQRSSFSVYGFGEAAEVYFNKDVKNLTLPEAAYLTGLIRGPNFYSPHAHLERSEERRNFVLERMRESGFITAAQARQAEDSPLGLSQQSIEDDQQEYFVDIVRAQLLAHFSQGDLLTKGYRIYTTLDPDLQKAAAEGARAGTLELDHQVKAAAHGKKPTEPGEPQVALVALDPATGDVKALVGGRSYGDSQLNHALAHRQPGSSFKPFVYAAALSSGLDGSQPVITPATILQDEPTKFQYSNVTYAPKDYEGGYRGSVTVRQALAYSLNVPAVQVAETVGCGKVRDLAVAAGFDSDMRATPAIALGAYEATPIEVAGSYTIFANHGEYAAPRFVSAVTDAEGSSVWDNPVNSRQVLDPRVSYLMVSLLESVVNNGTGAGIRTRGFKMAAAGKTGTSRDGWFAGFTPRLLAVAWAGYDDNHDMQLTGAQSALPMWTEFMKRAITVGDYGQAQGFVMPPGIDTAPIDNFSNLVAASADPDSTHSEFFIAGTEPAAAPQPQPADDQGQSADTQALPATDQLPPEEDQAQTPGTTTQQPADASAQPRPIRRPQPPDASTQPANLALPPSQGLAPVPGANPGANGGQQPDKPHDQSSQDQASSASSHNQ